MRTIFLIRHGQAHRGKHGISDYDRPLVHKGEKNVNKMAKRLKKQLAAPDLIITSPAERALTTAHIFAERLRFPIQEIVLKATIYDSPRGEKFLEIIREVDNKNHTVFFIGHEPTLAEFASYLVKGFSSSIPKSGVVGIDCDLENWRDITEGDGIVKLFDFPENGPKNSVIIKKFREDLGENIHTQVMSMLEIIDAEVAKKVRTHVKKGSKELAKEFVKGIKNYGDKSLLNKIAQNSCRKENESRPANEKVENPEVNNDSGNTPPEKPTKSTARRSSATGKTGLKAKSSTPQSAPKKPPVKKAGVTSTRKRPQTNQSRRPSRAPAAKK